MTTHTSSRIDSYTTELEMYVNYFKDYITCYSSVLETYRKVIKQWSTQDTIKCQILPLELTLNINQKDRKLTFDWQIMITHRNSLRPHVALTINSHLAIKFMAENKGLVPVQL